MTDEIHGTLRNAVITPVPTMPDKKWAIGQVYGDTKGRFKDGDVIHTSYIVEGPDQNGVIKTRNSVYRIESYA